MWHNGRSQFAECFWCVVPHSLTLSQSPVWSHTHTHSGKQIQSVWGVGMERPEPYQQTQQGRQRKQAGEKRQTSSLTHKHIHTHTHTHSHTHSCWGMFLALRVCGWTLLSGGTVSLCCLSHFHVTSTATCLIKTLIRAVSKTQSHSTAATTVLLRGAYVTYVW